MALKSNAEWEAKARTDPLHAIPSARGTRLEEGGWDIPQFFAKGEEYVDLIGSALSQVDPNGIVLDLGCGAGRISMALARRFTGVIGVDVSPSMLDLAGELCSGTGNVSFRLSNGRVLPLADLEVSTIVSLQVLQHIDSDALPATLGECHRVLQARGLAILHVPAPSLAATWQRWLRLVPVRYQVTKLVRRLAPHVDVTGRGWVSTQYHTYRPQRVESLLRSAGFGMVSMFEFRPGNPLTCVYVAEA